jgi:hypothetical protein
MLWTSMNVMFIGATRETIVTLWWMWSILVEAQLGDVGGPTLTSMNVNNNIEAI